MSQGGVCPPWLQCQPWGQPFVSSRLYAGQEGVLLFWPVHTCREALDLHPYPTQLRWCCFPSTVPLLYTLILVQVQPPLTYSRVAVFA